MHCRLIARYIHGCGVVPCHRVIGHDGSLTGYAGGLPRKALLLKLEGAPLPEQRLLSI